MTNRRWHSVPVPGMTLSAALPAVGSPHCPLELALPGGDSGLEERGAPGFTSASENELRWVGGRRDTPQPDSRWLLLSVRFGCLLSSKPRAALPRSGRPSSPCGSSGPGSWRSVLGGGGMGILEVMVAASGVHGARGQWRLRAVSIHLAKGIRPEIKQVSKIQSQTLRWMVAATSWGLGVESDGEGGRRGRRGTSRIPRAARKRGGTGLGAAPGLLQLDRDPEQGLGPRAAGSQGPVCFFKI